MDNPQNIFRFRTDIPSDIAFDLDDDMENMPDLSKLPWDECVLPEFDGKKTYIKTLNNGGGFEYCEIYYGAGYLLATQVYHQPERWELPNAYTVDKIEQIVTMCRAVEAFIKEHGG